MTDAPKTDTPKTDTPMTDTSMTDIAKLNARNTTKPAYTMPNHEVPAHLVVSERSLGDALRAIYGRSRFIWGKEGDKYIVRTRDSQPADIMQKLLEQGAVTAKA